MFRFRPVKPDTYNHYRLGIDLTAELNKFISSKTILIVVHPHIVRPSHTIFLWTNSPLPAVLCGIATSRPTEIGRMKFFYCLINIRSETSNLDSGTRHHTDLVNLQAASFYSYGKVCITFKLPYIK